MEVDFGYEQRPNVTLNQIMNKKINVSELFLTE
jgi:hypothetical protein